MTTENKETKGFNSNLNARNLNTGHCLNREQQQNQNNLKKNNIKFMTSEITSNKVTCCHRVMGRGRREIIIKQEKHFKK